MTGTLPSLPLTQHIDENGLPQSGCRLFLFEANTSTPVVSYKDYLLSTGMEHPNPIVGNALGRIPMFWLPDGFYRARLEDRYGTPLIDEAQLPALGTGEGEGGEPPAAAIQWSTGDFLWQPVAAVREGWVRANARTIGNALSGAGERANADCANLFAWFWNNFDDTLCPVTGGRGGDAPADFVANKQIATLDMRGAGASGLDGMGNSLSGRFANVPAVIGGVDTPGSIYGDNRHIMTVAEMPTHNHNATGTFVSTTPATAFAAGLQQYATLGGVSPNHAVLGEASLTVSGVVSVSIVPIGGFQPHNNMHRSMLGAWYVRL